jgi:CRP/FNR family transcriptional regulator
MSSDHETRHAIDTLISDLPEQVVPAGSQIFRQGDNCNQYFVLTSGSAKIFTRSANGKEVLLYHVKPGSICVLTAACLIGHQHFPAEAVAETELHVRIMTRRQFDKLMESSAPFREYVLDGFGERINGLIQTIQKLALETIEQRLAKFLLMQPQNCIASTHQEIADEIGSAREVVSRNLKRFESNSLISLGRGQIELLDRQGLLALT